MLLLLRHLSLTKLNLICSVLMDRAFFVVGSRYRISSFWYRHTTNGTFEISVVPNRGFPRSACCLVSSLSALFKTNPYSYQANRNEPPLPLAYETADLFLPFHVDTDVDSRRYFNPPLLLPSILPLYPSSNSLSTPKPPSRTFESHPILQCRRSDRMCSRCRPPI